MGSIGDAYDNAMAESFFSTLQRELLDEHRWQTRRQLALAVFEWIEAWYNRTRASATPAQSTTKPVSLPPLLRHDHHNKPVR